MFANAFAWAFEKRGQKTCYYKKQHLKRKGRIIRLTN